VTRGLLAAALGMCLGAGLLFPSGAGAADLPGRGEAAFAPAACLIAGRSPLLDLPPADVAREVEFRYGRAVATSNESSVIASSRPVFPWAMEARMACGTAIGYLRGAVVDDVSVSRCDCFHDRMVGHFR
jgi:hypothetical protein